MFSDDYHFVAIAADKMDQGQEVFDKLRGDRQGGLPWIVILDGNGNEKVTSNGPKGNVGCPVEPHEIEHFVDMIKQSSAADEERLNAISEAMQAYAKKLKAG